jgi:hypothetical protein
MNVSLLGRLMDANLASFSAPAQPSVYPCRAQGVITLGLHGGGGKI